MESDEFKKFTLVKSVLAASYSTVNNQSPFSDFLRDLTPLQVAAMIDGVDMCRNLVEKGADVYVKCGELGATLLHCAALNEKHGLELIDYFSSLGLKLNAKDKFGNEPLEYAIRVNNSRIVQNLLPQKYPKEENSKDKSESQYHSDLAKLMLEQEKGLVTDFGETGRSAIHLAAMLGDLDMCKLLLKEGADVRCLTKNEFEDSVLHCAAFNKSHGSELVQYFVSEHSFDVNAKDKLGFTPLHCALYKENIEIAEELLKFGGDLTVKRVTNDYTNLENLMHYCLRLNKMKSAKFLQQKNRYLVNDIRGDGYTSLHIAAMFADLVMCKWLVDECGLDPRALAGTKKISVLDDAACNKSHGKEIITFFVNNYALDVNGNDKLRNRPLHHAFYNNNIVAANELKTFIDFQRDSLTPLQVASMIDGVDMCRNLIEEGADVNVKCEELDATLMHCAALNEKHGLDLIDYFSSLGLKLDANDKFGNEPLQYAIKMNNSKVAEKLLQPKCPEEENNKDKSESRYTTQF
ncbi:serine/threonine-protein phosphatase 6 regulatory ankyrin repeat subunit A-like [Cloeon dipterum]|uniref:serine/threonine-protein phosphatase 6 regulatory ankyrin repeat subunit A-like n=1 Tax=Cloeon dipterum TaxID=197152 RepID=UPI00321FB877